MTTTSEMWFNMQITVIFLLEMVETRILVKKSCTIWIYLLLMICQFLEKVGFYGHSVLHSPSSWIRTAHHRPPTELHLFNAILILHKKFKVKEKERERRREWILPEISLKPNLPKLCDYIALKFTKQSTYRAPVLYTVAL